MQVVARTQRATRLHIVPASQLWHIPPAEVARYLVIEEGTPVQEGDLLLEKKQLLGKKRFESPVAGTFYGLNDGRIVLQQYEWFELRALVNGRVVNTIPQRGIVLEIVGTQIQGVWGSGKEGYGRLQMLAAHEKSMLAADEISIAENAIIVASVVNDPEVLIRLHRAGASGLIAGSMSAEVMRLTREHELPIILTDSIGTQGMARNIFDMLRDYEGAEVALFARQPDYWGNRPEIIITHDKAAAPPATPKSQQSLALGQKVRILRAPYQSQIGEVTYLYRRPRETEIGIKALGADVRLVDGSIVFVPYVNLDTIV